jgi:hypothetical protein
LNQLLYVKRAPVKGALPRLEFDAGKRQNIRQLDAIKVFH